MEDVRNKYVPPSISETAFNCPHCGALARQHWFQAHADPYKKDGTPLIMNEQKLDESNLNHIEEPKERERLRAWAERMAVGRPFIEANSVYVGYNVFNIYISKCYNCDDIAIWIYDRLSWPLQGAAPTPNPDLPDDMRADYEEASTILDLSPRGAAALLRLGIQKLCKHLGEPGKNINDDIQALVAKELDVRVQQALDVVRVVGNNAVHPGQIDLKDDRATAEKLFGLVNLIAEIMISQPSHIKSMYDGLPKSVRTAIEKRDKK